MIKIIFPIIAILWLFAWNNQNKGTSTKIAEHWDVIETILPKAEHKNFNGKYQF